MPFAEETWNARGQATYIWQKHPSFPAAYSGANSLNPREATGYSFTGTAFLGFKPRPGTEIYFNPEVIQAVAFSDLTGLGGLTNSEQQKGSGPSPVVYTARLFVRQTLGLGGGQDAVASAPNQLAGMVDKRRIVVTAGKISIIDLFDNNAYGHDARTQFTNWALLTHGAFDYAADARGYTIGAAAEAYYDDWVLRGARYMVPQDSNGLILNSHIGKYHGDQIELEHAHTLGDQSGKIKILAFRNKAVMGKFSDALQYASVNGGTPDVGPVRKENFKVGYGLALEQSVRPDIGFFARASWNDGETETYSFTEIERSVSAGLIVNGASWKRSKDNIGLGFAKNGLSALHREYLAAGGLGFFIGDGQLPHYRPEQVFETYYDLNLYKNTWLMAGYQRVANPAYNADRGPVDVFTLRLHAEY